MPKIGVVLALDGEQKFTQAMKNAQQAASRMDSALKDLKAEYKDNAQSAEALEKQQQALKEQQEAYNRLLTAAKTGQSNAKKAYKEQAEALEKLQQELEDAEKALSKMDKATDPKGYADQEKAVESLAKAVDKQTTNYLRAEGRLSSWDSKVAKAETSVKRNTDALNRNESEMRDLQAAADRASNAVDRLGDSMDDAGEDAKESGSGLKNFISSIPQALAIKGIDLAGDAIMGLKDKAVEAAKYVVKVGSEFESAMSKVQALSGASGSQLQQISDKARELGGSTRFSATEVAEAFSYMSLAGWDTQQMLDAVDGVVNLAAASEMDLAEASDMVTDYLSAFGLQATDAGRMVDELTYAQSHSNTTTAQLGEAFSNCAADMHASGQDMETTTSILEAMANQGTKGAEAGTALSAMMRDISQKMKDGKIQIGDTSVAVKDQEGNFRDLTDIMRDVEAATDGMGDADKRAALQQTFTARSMKAVNEVLTEGVDKIAGYEEALRSSEGTASEVAATMQNNLGGKLTELNSAAEGLGIALYDKVKGPLTSAVEVATGLINGITEAITPQQTALDKFLQSVEESNLAARGALDASIQKMDTARSDVAKVESLAGIIRDADEAFGLFAEKDISNSTVVTSSATASESLGTTFEQIVTDASGAEEAVGGIGDADPSGVGQKVSDAEAEVKTGTDQITEDAKAAVEGLEGIGDASIPTDGITTSMGEVGDAVGSAAQEMDAFTAFKVKGAIQELAKDIPALADAWDDTTNSLRITRAEFDMLIDTHKRAIMQQALNDAAVKATQAYTEALLAQASAQAGIKGVFDEANKWMREYATEEDEFANKQITNWDELQRAYENHPGLASLTDKYKEFHGELDDANETLKASKEQADLVEQGAKDLAKQLGLDEDAIDGAADSAEKGAEANAEYAESEEEAAAAAEEAQQRIADAHQNAADAIIDAYEAEKDAASKAFEINPFDAWTVNEENGIAKFQESLDAQIAGITNYVANLDVVRSNLGQTSPELLRYIEEMGTEGAQLVKELADAFDPENGDPEKAQQLIESYTQYLDAQDTISGVLAADKIAIELGLKDLGSTDVEFSELSAAVADAFSDVDEALRSEVDSTVEQAKEMGIKIPDGLTEGIQSGNISPDQMLSELRAAMTGQMSGLAEIAKQQGIQVDQALIDGINDGSVDPVAAFSELIGQLQGMDVDLSGVEGIGQEAAQKISDEAAESSDTITSGIESAVESAASSVDGSSAGLESTGTALMDGMASGIENSAGKINTAASKVAKGGADAAKRAASSWKAAGTQAGANYATGVRSGTSAASSAAATMANTARITAGTYASGFYSVGAQMGQGISNGLASQTAAIAAQAANTVRRALQSAKEAASIASPSKKFRDEVGKQIGAGVAMGIKLSTKDTEDAAQAMVNTALSKATSWLAARAGTTADEVSYAYGQLSGALLKNMFGVSKTTTSGTGKNQKTVTKTNDEYYGDVLKAAESYFTNMTKLRTVSTKEELSYWQAVQAKMKVGTQAYIDATEKIRTLQASIGTYDVADNLLNQLGTYYDFSEKAVMDYWDRVRKQYAAGTADRISADKKYFDAKKAYTERLKDIEDDYADKIADVNEKYSRAVEDRKKQIADAYGIFDEFESKSVTGDQLLFNMQSQAAGYQDWSKQLDALAGRGILSEELLQELREQGPEQVAAIHALNSLTDKQLKDYQTAYNKKMDAAQAQATKENTELKKTVQKEIQELQKKRAEEIKSVNTGLSTNVASLAGSMKSIADDMVNRLVAAITSGKSSSQISSATNEIINPAGASTSAPAAAPAAKAAPATAAKTTKEAKTGYGSNAAIDAAIKAAPNHSKSLTAAEKKSHVELWRYIAEKYGKEANTKFYIALGKALGVKTGNKASTITNAQKAEMLKLLKQKGYASGTPYIPRNGYIWMDEAGAGSEMILRQADNARLAYAQRGDAIVPAANTANLWKWSQIDPSMLESTAVLNAQLAQAFQAYAVAGGQQSSILSQITGLLQQMLPYVAQDKSTYLDGRKISEGTVDYTSRELAMRDRRRRA